MRKKPAKSLTCGQCGATWIPRKPEPVQCPRCKRVDWRKSEIVAVPA